MFYTINEFAEAIGVSASTLRLWDKNGKLKPHHRTQGKQRVYSDEQIAEYFNKEDNECEMNQTKMDSETGPEKKTDV